MVRYNGLITIGLEIHVLSYGCRGIIVEKFSGSFLSKGSENNPIARDLDEP